MFWTFYLIFFSSRRRHTRYWRDWSSDVCSSDLKMPSKFKTPSVKKAFGNGTWKIKVVSGYNHYTYKTAPQNVRTRYEANCKSINKTPNDSDRKSTRLNSSHANISYAVFCLKKKT